MNTIKISSKIELNLLRRINSTLWPIRSVYDNWIIVLILLLYLSVGHILNHKFEIDIDFRFGIGKHWFDFYIPYFLFAYFFIYMSNEFFAKNFSIKSTLKSFFVNYTSLDSLIGFLIVYFLLNPFFGVFSSLKRNIPYFNNYYADKYLMNFDYVIHFGNHPWEILQPLLGVPIITKFLDLCYSLWFFLLFGVCLWMAFTRHRRIRLQFFVSFFVIWIVLGNILAPIFASGGPCYFEKFVEGHDPYKDLFKYLSTISYNGKQLLALQNQNTLWQSFESGVPLEFGGGISAMPSLHVAIAFLFALLGNKFHKITGLIFASYAVFIFMGSVHLGWHYAIDGYISMFLVFLIWKSSDKLLDLCGYS